MKHHAPLIVGNWKMNPATVSQAKKLFIDIRTKLGRRKRHTEVAIAPPFPFISEMERLTPSQRIGLSAQDVFFESTGAYTGEISISMLKSVGVSSVIIGHSERRALGETDTDIYKDVQAVLKSKVTAIVCVGEKARDSQGNYFGIVEAQLRSVIRDIKPTQLKQLVIAYEPIWAIGTGKTATPEDAEEMRMFINKILTDRFGRKPAEKIRILYGGSVKKANAEALLTETAVDGFLIGGASLKAEEFVSIITIAETYAKTKAA